MPNKPYNEFVKAMAQRESSGRASIKNRLGFLGKFQFGMARLTDFGLAERVPGLDGFANSSFRWKEPFSEGAFLSNEELQDKVFDLHVGAIRQRVKNHFVPLLDHVFFGVKLTMSGAVACCHLLGEGGFRKFTHGIDAADANGTKASDYVRLFQGYDIPSSLPKPKDVDLKAYVAEYFERSGNR